MKQLIDSFSLTPDSEKKQFLEDNLANLSPRKKIDFYLGVLKFELSPILVKEILVELNRIGYQQKKLFNSFLRHENSLVAQTAREILSQNNTVSSDRSTKFINLLHEGDDEDREYLVSNLFSQDGPIDTKIALAVLRYDDPKLRKLFISLIEDRHIIDELELALMVKKKGIVWYTRAAIVEILGNRKSLELLNVIDDLIKDVNVEVKLKLINILAYFPKEKVKDHLHSLCNDKFLWVRKEAKKVLARL